MSQASATKETPVKLSYKRSTHAPMFKRYMHGEFQEVGEKSTYGRVDPETGAEYRALGGSDHKYNKDYKIGGSYDETVFITASGPDGDSLSHEELRHALADSGLWSDALTKVILPKAIEHGTPTWWYGYQFRPPNRAPRLDRVENQLERLVDGEEVYALGNVVEVFADIDINGE